MTMQQAWAGYVIDGKAWPPKDLRFPRDFHSFLKWIDAKLSGGKLVWLRDCDNVITLAVCRVDDDNRKYAARFWPGHCLYALLDDGSVCPYHLDVRNSRFLGASSNGTVSAQPHQDYAIQWIALDSAEQMLMLIKNYDLYNKALPE